MVESSNTADRCAGPFIDVTNLTKRYGPLTALSNVSFSVRQGEILGLIGPNGSGKTTLFEWLGGVLPAESGSVLQSGRPLSVIERGPLLGLHCQFEVVLDWFCRIKCIKYFLPF
jgi:branched-chain amino acid transport system ATP-binding protein